MVFRDSAQLHRNTTTNSVYVPKVLKVYQVTSKDIKLIVQYFLYAKSFTKSQIRYCNNIYEKLISDETYIPSLKQLFK